ncbi:hypothetical protein KIN20_036918 [Parelaphostrongylus tenuis]|uniref:Uncharacterized protein n=1 Tax=Parelaphostrongylus tenuis TaxID=148309 RepID=A0AAD5RDV4_PARTN|nr:hypothetical protein KIN20_036918 [Parelaphostrongylus tenuis]
MHGNYNGADSPAMSLLRGITGFCLWNNAIWPGYQIEEFSCPVV